MKWRCLSFDLVPGFLALVLCAGSAVAQEKIAYVLDVNGEWYLGTGANVNLKKGSALPGGTFIKARQPNDVTHFIVIADRNGRIMEKRYCRDRGACDRAIQLPAAIETQPSLAARLIDAVMGLWSGEPARYKTFASRGSAHGLQESVALLEDGHVDLKDMLAALGQGEYTIQFMVPADQPNLAAVGPLAVSWGGTGSASIAAGSLTPGLYQVQMLDAERQQPLEIGTEAWVLITTPADYPMLSSQFNDGLKMARGWRADGLKPTTMTSFLRAYLDYLNAQSKK